MQITFTPHSHQKTSTTLTKRNDYSFRSLGTKPLGQFSIKFFETMNSSVAANFLVLDFFGMVLPRVWQAYNRNSEELGHKNFAAAQEELIREIPTGPGLVIMPILFSVGLGKWIGKSINTPSHLLNEYASISKKIVASPTPGQNLKETFFHHVFDASLPTEYTNRKDLLAKLKNLVLNDDKTYISKAKYLISNYNKLHGRFKERPFHIHLPSSTLPQGHKVDGNISQLVETAKHYYQDVLLKIEPYVTHPQVDKIISNRHMNLVSGRIINALAGIWIATATFKYAALFYSTRHKVFPGLYGLNDKFQYKSSKEDKQLIHRPSRAQEVSP